MVKPELVLHVAKKAGLTAKAAKEAVQIVFDTIAVALKRNEKVVVTGFGTFLVRKRAARKGRNPQTGEPMKIGPGKSPAFRPGAALKRAVGDDE